MYIEGCENYITTRVVYTNIYFFSSFFLLPSRITDATCTCEEGWIGDGCSVSTCSSNGKWDGDMCICSLSTKNNKKPQYWGERCELDTCPGYIQQESLDEKKKKNNEWYV
jgi:hypothetical protein